MRFDVARIQEALTHLVDSALHGGFALHVGVIEGCGALGAIDVVQAQLVAAANGFERVGIRAGLKQLGHDRSAAVAEELR